MPKPRRRVLAGLAWASRAALVLAALLAISICVAWLVLQWAILPRIEHWRPELERRATAALGVEVRIGAVEITDAGSPWRWARAIELRDVRLLQPAAATGAEPPALALPRVRAALSPASLLPGWDGRWRLRFDQLLVEGAELSVRRERDGRILVAGFEPGPSQGGDEGAAADWFFSQHEVAIRHGRVTWTDALRANEPLVLEQVDLVVRNGVRRHRLRLDATPPAAWGERLSLRGEFVQPLFGAIAGWGEPGRAGSTTALLARPGDWRRWRGQLYAELPAFDVAPLRAHVALPIDWLQGRGALRAWIDVKRGTPDAATLDLALRDVAVQAAGAAEPLAFARVEGRLGARLVGGGPSAPRPALAAPADEPAPWRGPVRAELRSRGFAFETADGLVWPPADFDLDARFDAEGRLAGGALKAPRLDLGLLAKAFERLPAAWVGAEAHAAVAALGLEGIARGLDARWQGPLAAPQSYALKGRIEGLALAAASRGEPDALELERPGVRRLDVQFDATEAGGEAQLAMKQGELDLPGVFDAERLPFDRLEGRLKWLRTAGRDGRPEAFDLRASDWRFANADAQGELQARWQRNAATSALGLLNLSGNLARLEALAIPRWLPARLPADLRGYLSRAIQGGGLRAVDVRLKGDLRDFPFAASAPPARKPLASKGEFRVAAQLDGVQFAYQPGAPDWDPKDPRADRPWPAFTDIKGELIFERQSLELRRLQGRLAGVGSGGFELSGVKGGIRDLMQGATLLLEGSGRGPLADALAYVQATPIERWTGGVLAQAQAPPQRAAAPLELQLALELPLADIDASKVRGQVLLAGNDLRLKPELPVLGNARARVDFTEQGFRLAGGARLLGGDATVDGGSAADGSGVRLAIQGNASIDGLRRFLGTSGGAEPPAAGRGPAPLALLSGQAAYKLALGFPRGQPEWLLTSNLVGTAIDAPAPLRKSAEASLPLQVRLGPVADASGAARELLRVELGAEGARVAQAAWLREPGPQGARVLRGSIGIGDEPPPMSEAIAARVVQDRLDLDAWQAVLDPPGPAGAAAPNAAASGGYAPGSVVLHAQTLTAGARDWHRVEATVARGRGADEGLWRAEIDAAELAGALEYRAPGTRGGGAEGRLSARLARLQLPRQESETVSRLLDPAAPSRLPALDIAVDELELNGKRLGRVEVEAVNRAADGDAAAGPGEWTLNRLRVGLPGAQLNASGRWAAGAGNKRRALMDFKLDVTDGAALLARLGQPDVIKGAQGSLAGQLQWSGSPLSIDYPSLAGTVHAEFAQGQFLKADPGIAKLLGVLSLQSLPRRLLFDFRDVFEQGFAFDSVQGDVEIAEGLARTRNLRMKGVQATVLMEGRADLGRETQDLHVWVVPEINAGAASLAVAAINPAVGIGSFLAQLFLRRPLIEAGTREFHVTGPWAEPKVERIERTRAAPLADEAAPTHPPEPKETPR
ncbi:MAG TPA: AsmA-like C-terminal region-containing protein [Methylibium sp.]|uniref:YhdP family phospholipid transporter n=1 Tax=Methylibium sp. TaxID=2067992 RepID=UPI002DB77B40|nr:AsmA-like C-terminal region-containing protein [Methylibium sp.]HEU4460431.1 AsmA-like C-terminal region-containing protein [Methylibium sp.]